MKKGDVSRWREKFADHCRQYGLKVEASRRTARGALNKNVPSKLAQMLKRLDKQNTEKFSKKHSAKEVPKKVVRRIQQAQKDAKKG